MKQLSIEQKAKAYDDIIKKANKMHHENCEACQMCIEELIPELKESENEKIRKALIDYFNDFTLPTFEGLEPKKILAWLKKQGEKLPVGFYYVNSEGKKFYSDTFKYGNVILHVEKQGEQNLVEFKPLFRVGDVIKPKDPVLGEPRIIKGIHPKFGYDTNNGILDFEFEDNWELVEQNPSDKVEPKFKVGDWINGYYTNYKVLSANNEGYVVEDIDGNKINILFENEKFHHLWTIQDAKDGDVLVNWSNTAFIFKAIEDETVKFHIAYNEKWNAIKTPSTKLSHLGFPEPQFEFYPATKEQRDTLEKAMADAGYTFDFEKKELKKEE